MSKLSTYPLRLPKSLKNEVAKIAKRDQTSMNQFIAMAVAEKISALDTEQFFTQRKNKADMDAFKRVLFRTGGEKPRKDDLISNT